LVLGDAFYRASSLVVAVEKLQDLEACLRTTLASPRRIATDEVLSYFQDVWEHTFPGELYLTEPANIAACANSLLDVLLPQAAAPR
jgi:hypothetical protein